MMKNLKLLSVLIIFALAFSLAACGKREKPETAMENVMQAIINQDDATVESYFDNDDAKTIMFNGTEQTPQITEEPDEFVALVLKHLSYTIINTEEKDDTAVVTVEITNADMGAIFSSVMQKAFSELLSSAFLPEDQRPTDEEIETMYMQWFSEAVNAEDAVTVTKTVDITMHYADDHWKIESSAAFKDALLGGLVSTAEDWSSSLNS